MKMQARIEKKLTEAFRPHLMRLENESHMHSVPPGSETHFKLLLVSDFFSGMSRVARQRAVNDAVSEELKSGVHAFSQRIYSVEEWEKSKDRLSFDSPRCMGGSKSKSRS